MSAPTDTNLLSERVKALPGGEFLMMCYSCGTCTSKCMIQPKLDPNYNPRRLIREAVFEMEAEAFADTTTWLCSACDLCYPACPQKIHISGVINAVKALAVEQGWKNPNPSAVVDIFTCVACGMCVEVCPYQAVSLVETKVAGRGLIPVAAVDPGKCMACGMCSAACRSTSISLPTRHHDKEIIADLWAFLAEEAA